MIESKAPSDEPSRHYFFQNIEFWAERGLITMVDVDRAGDESCPLDKACKRISPGKFLKQGLAAYMSVPAERWPSDGWAARKMLEEVQIVVKAALAQGNPTDPKVQAEYAKNPKGPVSLFIPGEGGSTLYENSSKMKLAPGQPRKYFTGDREISMVPDLELPASTPISQTMFDRIRK